jgi:hypothetical protein
VNNAIPDDKSNITHYLDVMQRVAINHDKVSELANFDGAKTFFLANLCCRDVIRPGDAIVRRGLNAVFAAKCAEVRARRYELVSPHNLPNPNRKQR